MRSIVLINPPLTTEERYGVKSQSGGQTPPLGLANLAAMTRQQGFDTTIIDAAALQLDYAAVVEQVNGLKCDTVGITAVTISIDNAARLADLLKASSPHRMVIIGGPHLTAVPEETMRRYPVFDVGVIGEGDYTLVDLLDALDLKKDLHGVQGLILNTPTGPVRTEPRPRVKNLDDLPMPAWDLLPRLDQYYCPPVHTLKRIPAALLIASRGCPGHCTFCDRSVFGNKMRAYSAEYTFSLIKELYTKYGIREIQLRDDNFTAFRSRLLEWCAILKREKLDLVWTCAGRVDMVTPEVLKAMKDAGCWQIWYGIESGSQEILERIKKETTIEQIERAVNLTHQAGISPCGFFMIGNPGETKETLQQTIDLALRLPLDEAHFSFVTPFPGSELYLHAREYGSFNDEWKLMNGWRPLFVPHGLTDADLEHFSNKAFRRFFFRPRIIWNYVCKIRSWRHLKIYLSGFTALIEFLLKKKSAPAKA